MNIIKYPKLFTIFKYTIYSAVFINIIVFFLEEWQVHHITYTGGLRLSDIFVAFSATTDTIGWFLLLIILEFETFIFPDEKLTGPTKSILTGLSIFCWIIIAYAAYGYIAGLEIVHQFQTVQMQNPCIHIAENQYKLVRSLDDYVPLDAQNCQTLSNMPLLNSHLNLLATPENFTALTHLTWTDIINALTWLIIVLILLIEVTIHTYLHNVLQHQKWIQITKLSLYGILLFCLSIWIFYDKFWDSWDAILWLAAFFFIEKNISNWQAEQSLKKGKHGP